MGCYFVLAGFEPRRCVLPVELFLTTPDAALPLCLPAALRVVFLGCRVLDREPSEGTATRAASRTCAVTVSGREERFSVNLCVTLVSLPAA